MAVLDNYLPCESYAGAPDSEKYPGFKSWHEEATNLWYFAVVTNRGTVVLRSEGYTTESARDNGIESVMRNRDIEERYAVAEGEDGKWYVILKAGNHQEIARSCAYDDEAAARAGIAMCSSDYVEMAASRSAAGQQDEYMPCDFYAGRDHSDKYPGFSAWHALDNNQYYFAALDKKGHVLLRSEAYNTPGARDNGIESVMRNRDIEARYSVVQDETDGEWYVALKAGNHQEIARSCGYETEAAAAAGLKACLSASSVSRSAAGNVEDYMPCEFYAGHVQTDTYPGFVTIHSEETGLHYFAMVEGNGAVVLRSEGYTTPAARDNGIQSVIKNRDLEERYAVVQDEADGMWYVSLKAGNHQEIARSCALDSEEAAHAHMLHCYSKVALERMATGADQIIEDYLPCSAYEGHPESTEYKGFSIFQDEATGLHYFAMLDDSGKVALKSEGYKDPNRRDNGIESVIRNRGIEDHWRQHEDEHGHYMSLRAVNHQEIGRTCHYKDSAAMLAWFAPLMAGHAAWSGDAEPEEKLVVAETVAPPVELEPAATTRIVSTVDKTPPPSLTTYTDATPAAAGGGSDWWKWLLGALLLAALLWLLMRGCDGCGKTTEVSAPAPAAPAPTTVAPAPADPQPAPAPATPVCNCTGNDDPLFNIPSSEPKALHRLGTNPEFGNSHDLTPAQFYQKLAQRAKSSGDDKRFLDRVFKGMGYAGGFADAKPEMFSAVTLAPGTTGNIGYSKAHKTLYARLDTEGKDLMAFRIKSANGCDMHFMKTCGNHFFTCLK